MSDPYRIIRVRQEWRHETDDDHEDMGTKEKFWYRSPDTASDWLFKFPESDDTGQHWAEKIAAELAAHLEIPHAKVELAEYEGSRIRREKADLAKHQGNRGSVTELFTRDDQVLVHGNEMLAPIVEGYNTHTRSGQSTHTLSNVWRAIDHAFVKAEDRRTSKLRFAEYLLLDALIGNTDRHHENWGVLRMREGDQSKDSLAPSFDHGSSLGRELLDEKRDKMLAEDRVGRYVDKAPGAIYWSERESRGLNALELVRRGTSEYPDIFRPALAKLENLDVDAVTAGVDRVPDDWMTPSARRFAIAVLCCRIERLGALV